MYVFKLTSFVQILGKENVSRSGFEILGVVLTPSSKMSKRIKRRSLW